MNSIDQIRSHIKTHSERSVDDISAVSVLQTFLRSGGKINANFASNDKWPNTDGTFEFVSKPEVSRRPEQNFFVQIKGTCNYNVEDEEVNYHLQNLGFPAFAYSEVTLDPCILFVVLNPNNRGKERLFWKYMSVDFLSSIDYLKNSKTIKFTKNDEILNTNESVECFCENLEKIMEHHNFVSKLDNRNYNINEIFRIINVANEEIKESIERLEIFNDTRDNVSRRMLNRMYDICTATLLLNSISLGDSEPTIQLAWEKSLLDVNTRYLGNFLKGLKYIGNRIPEEGQSERLLLKYYNFLWEIRRFMKDKYKKDILINLEKFPRAMDKLDQEYYGIVAKEIDKVQSVKNVNNSTRYFIQKKTVFYVDEQRYFEITLQLAERHASKYNRFTVYSKEDIISAYSLNILYQEEAIELWGIQSKIKIVIGWRVSIDPKCINALCKTLNVKVKISKNHGEYIALMDMLTYSGMSLIDLIDLKDDLRQMVLNKIYRKTNTSQFEEVIEMMSKNYSISTNKRTGKNVVRQLLLHLREEDFEKVWYNQFSKGLLCDDLFLSKKCYPFDRRPFLSNLSESKTSLDGNVRKLIEVAGFEEYNLMSPYVKLRNKIKDTGEIYFEGSEIATSEEISRFNSCLDFWEKSNGYNITRENGFVTIDSYEKSTLAILQKLLWLSQSSNAGQEPFNKNYIDRNKVLFEDPIKKSTIINAFVSSKLLLIYGAAGTGKTYLLNCLSNLMGKQKKLFLTKTLTALQNLKRNIDNPGIDCEFVSIDSFTKKVNPNEYDIVFVDECSTIDNKTMEKLIERLGKNTFLVLAGDVYQIESIDFGNWFTYAKEIIKTKGANIELSNTWRTNNIDLRSLWDEVREKQPIITEKLVVDGPFSEDISSKIFKKEYDDEVVLCLNYDGKFGLNNVNAYFQNANTNGEVVNWRDWSYKVGDHILFNDSKRFSILHNNLKGHIVKIVKKAEKIDFVIDVETIITERDCEKEDIKYFHTTDKSTRIGFSVFNYDSETEDQDELIGQDLCIVPFQLAYAVSIHKAQGLEYDSVKIIIPSNNSERISHNIFYTAITRAKKKLKIYWSADTMTDILENITIKNNNISSLNIIKSKLDL